MFDFLNTTTYGKEIIKAHDTLFGKMSNLLEHKVQIRTSPYHYEPIHVQPEYGYFERTVESTAESNSKKTSGILAASSIASETLSIEAKEKELVITALEQFKHNRKQAAKELGISERTLYRKIKQYNLE